MSAYHRKAAVAGRWPSRRLLAITGHWHPDKTFIGRIERGFDFLGYHFGPEGLTMAARTIEQYVERALRFTSRNRERPQVTSG